jgi:hypothetical protein
MKALINLLAVGIIVGLIGCTIDPPTDVAGPNLGSVTVTKYVAIGNSLAAGYQSNGLYQSAQAYSYPYLIATQLRNAGANLGNFEQPWYSDPGNADPLTGKAARYEIISLTGPVIGPRGLTAGSATNSALARPYDNLGVPGAVIFDLLDTTSIATKALPSPNRNNPFFSLVMRSQASFGKRILDQAKALNPSIVSFWLGNNDVLGFATSGGASPNAPTSSAAFGVLYNQAIDSLKAVLPNAKLIVATIPDVKAIPFFTTIGQKIALSLTALPGVYLRYQQHGNTSLAFDSTRLTEANPPLICLTGSPYASLLGTPTGKWYRDLALKLGAPVAAVIGAGIDTTKPFGFHPQNPWPDALVLDASEQTTAQAAVLAFNSTITTKAASASAAVVDVYAIFNDIKANGRFANGLEFHTDYVTGGLFSLDGVHPSNQGAAIIANEFIAVMNSSFGIHVAPINVASIPGLSAPISKIGSQNGIPILSKESFKSLEMLWGAN